MDIPSPLLGAADAVQDLLAGAADAAGATADFAARNLAALQPDEDDSFTLVSGPWFTLTTVADDDGATRVDDAPDAGTRLADGGVGVGRGADGARMDGHGPEASRAGTTLIGVEGGVLRFLAVDYAATSELGRLYSAGAVDFLKGQAALFADAGLDRENTSVVMGLGAQVLAEVIGAHYEGGYDTPTVDLLGREVGLELTGRFDAAVHAFARAWMEVSVGGRNALQVGGRAFAGASATISGQAELAPFADVHASGTAWAGMGAECTLGVVVDLEDGEVALEHSAGAAIGYGLSYDWGVSVSVLEVASFLLDQSGLEDPVDAAQSDLADFWSRATEFVAAVVQVVGELTDGDPATTPTAGDALRTTLGALVEAATRPSE